MADDARELNIRELRFLDGVLAGKSGTQAAIDAGYARSRAATTASEKMRDVRVRESLRALMDEKGLTLEAIVGKLQRNIDLPSYGLSRDGKAVELGIDGVTSARTMDQVLKVMGAYPDPRVELGNVSGAVIVLRPRLANGCQEQLARREPEHQHTSMEAHHVSASATNTERSSSPSPRSRR